MSAEAITRALGGRWHGSYGIAFCPAHDNTRTPALSLRDGTDGRLLARCHSGCKFGEVIAALRSAGLVDGRGSSAPPAGEVERGAAERRKRKMILRARVCWNEAFPIGGTLAERYLRRRGIRAPLPGSLRYHPKCWHGATPNKLPAMVAAVARGGAIAGVHRTYVAEPGIKAAIEPNKAMLGSVVGGAVPMSRGDGPIIVVEGIETALSLFDVLHEHRPRIWAALSTSGVQGLILPHPPHELVIAPDGDPPGRAAAVKLADRAWMCGWRVRIMDCPQGRDWNDVEGCAA